MIVWWNGDDKICMERDSERAFPRPMKIESVTGYLKAIMVKDIIKMVFIIS